MDNFIVSARKYRPASFDTVVGQLSITSTLRNAIMNRQLAQAYLFTGPRGVGKTTCARIFAKTINCMHLKEHAEPCDTCESCIAFNNSRSLNIHELDAASNNSVNDIRGLVEQVRILPQIGKYSVYIIDEVHMLSASAFNAFLKTLEEPPAHAIFILATTEKHKILPTILSRCQIYDFNRMKVSDTVEHLKYIAQKENVIAEEEALDVIAQKADGAMRDALSIFDQVVSFCGRNLTYDKVIENLNVLDYDYYFKLTDIFYAGKVPEALLLFNEILGKGFDAGNLITGLGKHFRDVLVAKEAVTVQLLEVSAGIKARYAKQAADCTADFLFEALKIMEQCEMQYKLRVEKRLCVELAFIRLCQINELKKKKLSASEQTTLLKIEGFSGKLHSNTTGQLQEIRPVQYIKPDPSFKINDSFKKAGFDEIPIVEQKIEERNLHLEVTEPFNEEKVILMLDDYIAKNISETTISIALKSHKIEIQDNMIIIAVDNQLQLEKLEAIKINMQNVLMRSLNNGLISLSFKIFDNSDGKEEEKLFTAGQKYERFVKLNPVIAELKAVFGLELE